MREFDVRALGETVFEHGGGSVADVAVVVSLYNYRDYIEECLASVLRQSLGSLSIIVIDDCSTDDGPRLAANFLAVNAARFVSARMLRHRCNKGLSMARNSGIAWSREPLLFMLDADNRLRRPALERLKVAIDAVGAAFAYSQLFMFGEQPDVGVADIWGVERLLRGNKVDAMALIRRDALLAAGGYAVLADDLGWEDYDLWCRFHAMGLRGVFVPELLCEYRRHHDSMTLRTTTHAVDKLMVEMLLRHPTVFAHGGRVRGA